VAGFVGTGVTTEGVDVAPGLDFTRDFHRWRATGRKLTANAVRVRRWAEETKTFPVKPQWLVRLSNQ